MSSISFELFERSLWKEMESSGDVQVGESVISELGETGDAELELGFEPWPC